MSQDIESKNLLVSKEDLQRVVGGEIEEYKKFAFRSNMMQMAVAFILGAAFNKFITSFCENVVMPVFNFLLGYTGVSWRELTFVPIYGLKIEIGKFLGSSFDFLIISMVLYFVYIKLFKGKDKDDPRTKN